MEMAELFAVLEETTGVPPSARNIPIAFLYVFAAVNEAWHFLSKKPVLLSRSFRLYQDKLPLESNYPCQGLQGSH
jgi:hypothetical protein